MPIEVQPEHGYVLAMYVASMFVHNAYMPIQVGQARKKYGVKYPAMYATEADTKDEKARNTFNCVQRAHQNCLENLPTFLSLLGAAGIKYPVVAASAGAVYLFGKVLYFRGYSTGVPSKRMQGWPAYFGLLTLAGCTCSLAYSLIMGK
eukprot:CAMPEP_0202342658 /NCGR_PEP_ID=MMETSP1126-20121109/3133_1 /ASSEMBLY_ACC=CAM_ASM_000457 /TAXON_ID=3047 /ORGANISM="Dunaliella tertiolecta, Strain CCMP1320" /LENGTH=147 /DNA_ID=CAMNT_0048933655 /DNA_START=56 /DNA_END=499 /DNA_ORIENTATION=+